MPDSFYPKQDQMKRALIEEYLDFNHQLRFGTNRLIFLKYFVKLRKLGMNVTPLDLQEAENKLKFGINHLDWRLSQHKYLVGDDITLADIAAICDIA